ncbi:negative elongation factor E-like, partial [Oncorhynchus tshawytscha]|uniref:negative elongation factor E-like n=1 Tax=Oncorhynchus tshawytscha TaxID=74940 RepID=UPI001C3D7BB8
MDTENIPHPYEDNRDAERQSRQSRSRSTAGKGSKASVRTLKRDKSRDGERDERDSCAGDQAKTRTQEVDPDRDRMSDREHRRSSSFYSEDYENLTPSEHTLSPYSRTPSPALAERDLAPRGSPAVLYTKQSSTQNRYYTPTPTNTKRVSVPAPNSYCTPTPTNTKRVSVPAPN